MSRRAWSQRVIVARCFLLSLVISSACAPEHEAVRPSRIRLEPLLELRGREPDVDLSRRAPTLSGQGYVATYQDLPPSGGVAVFAPSGELIRSLTKLGSGPGEFSQLVGMGFGPGDTLWVIDGFFKLHAFTPPPELRHVRTVSTTEPVIGVPGPLGILSPAFVQNDAVLPPRLVGWDGQTVRSFGARSSRGRASSAMGAVEGVDASTIWSASGDRYAIELVEAGGTVRRRVTRDVDWFPSTPGPSGFPWQVRPNPRIAALASDSAGILWVLVRRAHRDWSPSASAPAAGEGPMAPSELRRMPSAENFEYVLEAFDASSGRFRASLELEGTYSGFAGPAILSQTVLDADGAVSVRLLRVLIRAD